MHFSFFLSLVLFFLRSSLFPRQTFTSSTPWLYRNLTRVIHTSAGPHLNGAFLQNTQHNTVRKKLKRAHGTDNRPKKTGPVVRESCAHSRWISWGSTNLTATCRNQAVGIENKRKAESRKTTNKAVPKSEI